MPLSIPGFNGAADRSRRKVTASAASAITGTLLQWSRRPKSAEGQANALASRRLASWLQWSRRPKSAEGLTRRRGDDMSTYASMEPPTEVGGRSQSRRSSRTGLPPRFNGAADRSRRKVRRVDPLVLLIAPASMEPPTEVGGRSLGRFSLFRDAVWLQWSRRPKSAEGPGRPPAF